MKFQYGDNVLVKGKVLGIVEDGIKVSLIDDASNSNTMWFAEEQLIPDMTNVETIPQEEVMKSAYDQGLNDAWELARYINETSKHVLREIFDIEIDVVHTSDAIFTAFTPQEALEKLKAYEESQKIEVGDVVNHREYGNGVVTREDGDFYNVVCANGDVICFEKNRVTKTGKHLEIQQIIEQIGE